MARRGPSTIPLAAVGALGDACCEPGERWGSLAQAAGVTLEQATVYTVDNAVWVSGAREKAELGF